MTGILLALIGAASAVVLGGIGSAIGIKIAGQVGAGITAEDPEKFGKILILEALPTSQAIYGFVTAFFVLSKLGNPMVNIDFNTGLLILVACAPTAFTALISAIYQGQIAAAGMNIVAKTGDGGKPIMLAAMVETIALFGLLASILILMNITI